MSDVTVVNSNVRRVISTESGVVQVDAMEVSGINEAQVRKLLQKKIFRARDKH